MPRAQLLVAAAWLLQYSQSASFGSSLRPYEDGWHGSRITNAEAHSILSEHHGYRVNSTHEVRPASKTGATDKAAMTSHYRIEQNHEYGFITGSLFVLRNPMSHFSYEEPVGGCGRNRQRASVTAKNHSCVATTNAGFFDVNDGDCLGTLVINGKIFQNTGYQNAMFGLTKAGDFVTGYLRTDEVVSMDFENLVAGVVWLVRDGKNYVQASLKVENMTVQATGTAFATIQSARTALGHDADGNVVLFVVDGKSYQRGVNLYQMADLLVKFGVKNAINLDGGGSATAVYNGQVVNFPSDDCPQQYNGVKTSCERATTSATCFHDKRH